MIHRGDAEIAEEARRRQREEFIGFSLRFLRVLRVSAVNNLAAL